jgi:hypothetical protein
VNPVNLPTVAESIVTSRLLIVQSKRLMLSSAARRFRLHGGNSLGRRSEHFRADTARAHKSYQAAVLTWGRTTSHEFRIVAYTSLIVLAEKLVFELRGTIEGVAARDRVEMATEVEVLEDLIEEWRQSARPVATAAVA